MNLKKLSDHELLNTYISGNEDSINVLLNRHRKRILDYIYMMVKNRDVADDIFQETLIKVVRFVQEGRYTENGKFLSWVLRIAHNQVIDYFRQKKQRNNVSEGDAGYDILNNQKFSDHTVEEKLITNQIETDVRKLIDFLPPEQKEVVLMRYYMGLSFKEIAEHDYYNEEMADEVTREDEDLFDREVVQGDDDLMLTDAFLKEVFRKQ